MQQDCTCFSPKLINAHTQLLNVLLCNGAMIYLYILIFHALITDNHIKTNLFKCTFICC